MHIVDLEQGQTLQDVQRNNPGSVVRVTLEDGSVILYWPGGKAPIAMPKDPPRPTVIR